MSKAAAKAVSIDAKHFHSALARVIGAVEAKKTYPILMCVHLSAEDDELTIVATDLDIRIAMSIPCSGGCEPICVESARLLAVAGQLKDRGEISLAFGDLEGGMPVCRVSAGRSRFTLGTMSAESWPAYDAGNATTSFTLPGKVLADIMNSMAPAISNEETRYYLNGVHLAPGTLQDPRAVDALTAVATMGHKLYARHIEAPGVSATMAGIIVPRVTCGKIAKLFGEVDDVDVQVGEEKISLVAGPVAFISKLVEGTFPDWRRVAPDRPPSHSYDTADLIRAIDAAAAVTNRGKDGKAVKLTLGEDETEIAARDINSPGFTGNDQCRHNVIGKCDVTEIGINAEYLAEMLRVLDAETAQFSFVDATSPVVISAAAHDDRRIVIMPMRV